MSFGLGWVSGASIPPQSAASGLAWTRPIDWATMPTSIAERIHIVVAVTDDDSNYAAVHVTVTGGYTVDWGDGIVENIASAVQADHKYVYSTLAASVTTRGYKTAVITILPQGANPITAFNIGLKNATAGLKAYANPWLDVQVNTPSCATMVFQSTIAPSWLERVNFVAIGNLTSLVNMFMNCKALQSVTFPVGSLTGVLSMQSAFSSCLSLQTISFPDGSLASVTSLANTFDTCNSLRLVTFPAGSLVTVGNIASAFNACASLKSMTFPDGSLASVITANNLFASCVSLQSVSFPAAALTIVTNISSMFDGAVVLQSVAFPSGSLGSVTAATSTFNNCPNLEKVVNCAIPITFSINSSNMAATDINALYNSLPTVSAKTLTISSNHGYAASTQSIATGKGWALA